MSYIVLARKWRPQSFDDLIGQEPLVRTLRNAIINEKVAHAYLFSGPRGVGKTSVARILAKALNCSKGPTVNPCGQCPNCEAITDGSSIDVMEIDGASNTSVDSIRELREAVKYAPSTGRFKIYIIDEIHMLSDSAFNALLKTLEEPPAHVIFVFATTAPKKVPATIHSRCQHHAFRRIPKVKIKEQLSKISGAENINIKDPALEMIARAADGSMRDALTMLDQASSFSDDIGEKELQTLLGLPDAEIILKLSNAILEGNISENLLIIKELVERGYDLRPVVKELLEHFRNLAIVKITQNPQEFLEFTESEVKNLVAEASKISIEELTLLITQLLRLETEVRNAVNPRYVFELGLLRTSFVKGMTSIDSLLKKFEGEEPQGLKDHLPEHTEVIPVHGMLRKEKEPENKIEQKAETRAELLPLQDKTIFDAQGLWQRVIEKLKAGQRLLSCKLAEATLMGLTETTLTIGFNGGKSVFADSVKKGTLVVEDALSDITGRRLKLKIVSLPNTILSNPTVKNALELFNGTIVEIKPLKNSEQ